MRWLRSLITLLALALPACHAAAAENYDFTWENLLLASIKLDTRFDYESHVDAYMQLFRSQVWERVRNNEFELDGKRQETLELMKQRVKEFSLDRRFTIRTDLELGKYDFAAQEFPVLNVSETHYWYENQYSGGSFPSQFSVFLSNPELLSSIPMTKDKAEQFLRRRTDRYGNISREVPAVIEICIVRAKDGRDKLLGEIQSAAVFEDQDRKRVVWEVQKPASTADKDQGKTERSTP